MPWPIPSAKTIAERIAASIEAGVQAARPLVDPLALSRAVRSARGLLAQIGRAVAIEVREVQDHVSWWGRQYFPDTAEDEFADRHASIWGIQRRDATKAIGAVLVEGPAGTVLASALPFASADGTGFVSTAGGTIAANGSLVLPVMAVQPGVAGNLEAGIRLTPVASGSGIARATIAAPGLAGGAEIEDNYALTARVIERIRQPAHGGAAFDYRGWLAGEFDVRAVSVVPEWIGRGSVGLVVAMKAGDFGRAPTAAELDAMQRHIGRFGVAEGVRPVTARVILVPAQVVPLPIAVRLRPDTIAVRAAVSEAFARFVATIGDAEDERNAGPIGALIERSRLSEAISAAAGEYGHDLIEPAINLQLLRVGYPVPGVVSFVAPT